MCCGAGRFGFAASAVLLQRCGVATGVVLLQEWCGSRSGVARGAVWPAVRVVTRGVAWCGGMSGRGWPVHSLDRCMLLFCHWNWLAKISFGFLDGGGQIGQWGVFYLFFAIWRGSRRFSDGFCDVVLCGVAGVVGDWWWRRCVVHVCVVRGSSRTRNIPTSLDRLRLVCIFSYIRTCPPSHFSCRAGHTVETAVYILLQRCSLCLFRYLSLNDSSLLGERPTRILTTPFSQTQERYP